MSSYAASLSVDHPQSQAPNSHQLNHCTINNIIFDPFARKTKFYHSVSNSVTRRPSWDKSREAEELIESGGV